MAVRTNSGAPLFVEECQPQGSNSVTAMCGLIGTVTLQGSAGLSGLTGNLLVVMERTAQRERNILWRKLSLCTILKLILKEWETLSL